MSMQKPLLGALILAAMMLPVGAEESQPKKQSVPVPTVIATPAPSQPQASPIKVAETAVVKKDAPVKKEAPRVIDEKSWKHGDPLPLLLIRDF